MEASLDVRDLGAGNGIFQEALTLKLSFADALFQITREWFFIPFPNLDTIIDGILLTM